MEDKYITNKINKMRGILMIYFCFALFGCQATTTNNQLTEELVGLVSPQQLLQAKQKFADNYQAYQPSENELAAAKEFKGKSITVLFGAWCHDSQREVPRLLKVLDMAQSQLLDLKLIAVNRNKQEPSGLYRSLELRYTPTFVLFEGTTELGRVIETPTVSVIEDLAALTL
ncbi:thioredoxin family protein [Paraglaciecola sp.]|uniref:thioredoxin family protein n=1 Tax=Paraglaciecola sp. TaxID=1920173 RepID=UPI0030F4A0DB